MKTTKEVSSCGCAFSVLRQSKVSLTRIEGSGSEERSHHHPPHFPVHPWALFKNKTRAKKRLLRLTLATTLLPNFFWLLTFNSRPG